MRVPTQVGYSSEQSVMPCRSGYPKFLRNETLLFQRSRSVCGPSHTHMFANLIQFVAGRSPSPDVARYAFIEHVEVRQREPRSEKVERLICTCWMLIAVKHVLVIWACHHYPQIPFHQLWVNFPTWLLGVVATGLYYWRVR